ncbi:hypothetical protein [Methylocapsa sp. S129]|uniref:hypothetical protein n=1 Tax=Methylocapsa sp. S129 TaxID=1641869 RepID=UPI00131CF71D|nr:hypothetical protein [Methylocapsa sp. S129]
MPISAISLVDQRTLNSGRWIAAARANRPQQAAPAPATVEAVAIDGRDEDDASTWGPQRAMTLAAAQAAYASN